jgi:hypothetical protein
VRSRACRHPRLVEHETEPARIAEEVIAHLVSQVGAGAIVMLEIAAQLPNGASDQMVRAITENSQALKVSSHGFETE